MSNISNNAVEKSSEALVQTKRIRGRNIHDLITQVLELANTSEGWAVTKATMLGMGADVYLERSEKQSNDTQSTKTAKVETDVKTKEEVVEADKPSEKSDEVAVVEETESKPKQTRSTRSRTKSK